MDTIVRNGVVVTATDIYQADLGIRNGRISEIGGELVSDPNTSVIDAAGAYIFPGGVDVHTHLDTPSFGFVTADDYASGTIAAACGGTTSIVDFAQQEKGQSLTDTIQSWHDRARGKAAIDYGFHCVIQDLNEQAFADLPTLPGLGVTSFKIFLAYKGAAMVDDLTLIRALDTARDVGALVMVHAENGDAAYYLQKKLVAEGKVEPKYHAVSRPPRVEAEATHRAIALAEVIGAPIFIVHLTCQEALDEVLRGQARGVDVKAETCTQYLYTTEADLDRPDFEGAKFVFTPPPRQAYQRDILWRALEQGWLVDVSSDHSPWYFKGAKDRGLNDFSIIPNGGPGIEERLTMVYQGVRAGKLSLNRFVDVVATGPARVFGLAPRKGTIAIGSDADLVIWDDATELTLTRDLFHSKIDYTLYEGQKVRGVPGTVLLRGDVIVRNHEYVGTNGDGTFLHRARYGERLSQA